MDGVALQRRNTTGGAHRAVPQRRTVPTRRAVAPGGAHRAVVQRRHATAGAALAAASVVAITPVAPVGPWSPGLSAAERAVKLAAEGSLLNVPFNLFQDIVNIPANEIAGINTFGTSLMSSGTWWTASATNLWGEDTGDPARFTTIIDMLLPFKELSGQGLGALQGLGDDPDPYAINEDAVANGHLGLGQQFALFLNAQMPVSASSDADWSAPMLPTTPITGFTLLDRATWFFASLFGVQKFPLFDNWFRVPIPELMSGDFNFGDAINPSSGANPDGTVPNDMGFLGTHLLYNTPGDPDSGLALNENGNPIYLLPWSNLDFKLNLAYPLQNWWESLQQTPDMNGFDLPTFEDIGRAFQTLMAGLLVTAYPFVPGSSACTGGECNLPDWLTLQSLVKDISSLWPGNDTIDHWLDLVDQDGPGPFGMANGPTWEQVQYASWWNTPLQQWFDLGNVSPADPPSSVESPIAFPISEPMQNLIDFMKASGIQDFVQRIADAVGYVPIDPETLGDGVNGLDGADTVPSAEASDWLPQLLTDFGLGDPDLAALF